MKRTNPYHHKTIWIIGASDGIGKAVTRLLDKQETKLIISSRNQDKLQTLSRELSSEVHIEAFDVGDYLNFNKSIQIVLNKHKPDYILYFPGYYEPAKIGNISNELVDRTITINLKSVFVLIEGVFDYLKQNPACVLAVTASVAGYVGLPYSQPYAATKAAVINLVQSFKAEHKNFNIKLINPGFVKTKLTDKNNFKMPNLMEPNDAANAILKGLRTSRFEIHFPKRFTRMLKLIASLPYKCYFKVLAMMRLG
ncbi:SDR family NAD(P)-dependent oxidoreductase [Cysteiniphilum sp. 6C5]|uniref:SDR family NAD(P)-dependent oxidoreductase n=1 Tax=unclassified Cysteiniphilum TaxID=2610889 RepID=UPI003F841129